ncbi:hypothetical protein RBWH47_01989 [Rhodopirellula baltica WH47]|uniref:Uncharacterized protein n=1 Tax=Rhodopirellula baltica WH47 TaxID=991778 RepID=F2AVS2_RHOBT|nr:hypothetical protein RBWH47_01989 [Rhodopirellula baltica WH47]
MIPKQSGRQQVRTFAFLCLWSESWSMSIGFMTDPVAWIKAEKLERRFASKRLCPFRFIPTHARW